MEFWLSGYDQHETEFLVSGFKNGFSLQFSGPRIPLYSKNLKSAILHPDVLKEKLKKECSLGRILGPFKIPPFSNLRINPVGLIPKKSGGWRLITNLSYPFGESVNDYIDPTFCSVEYSKLDSVIDMIQELGQGALLGKLDIQSAFNLCPIQPEDFELLGIQYNNEIWIQKCLPQGAAMSCAIFERFSTALQWIISTISKSKYLDHYLDDFIFLGQASTNNCRILMTQFESVCKDIGIPLSSDKTEGPTTKLIYLGYELDSIAMEIRIPIDKINRAKNSIENIISMKKVRLSVFQSLVGLLNFFTKAIPSGRAFNCELYRAMSQAKKPHHFIRISIQIRENLKVWLLFLQKFNGVSVFSDLDWVSDHDLHLYTDAAGNKKLGCGAFLDGEWAILKWPKNWDESIFKDITFLELVPILLAFHLWNEKLKGKKIILHTDNLSLVQILNKKTSRNNRVMFFVRKLVLQLLFQNIQLRAVHISSKKNVICDALSRLQIPRLISVLPDNASKTPLSIPQEFVQLLDQRLFGC